MGNCTSEIVARSCEASYTERQKSLNQDLELLYDTSVVFSSGKLSLRSDLSRYKVGPEASKSKEVSSDPTEESMLYSQYDSLSAKDRNESTVKSLMKSISQTTEIDIESLEITKRLQAFCRVFEAIIRVDDLKNKKSDNNLTSSTNELPTAARAAIKFGLNTLLNLIECVAGVNPLLFEFILNDANSALADSKPLSLMTTDSTLLESFEKISVFFDSVVCGKIKSLSEEGSLVSLLPLFKLALASGSVSSFMLLSKRLVQLKTLDRSLKDQMFTLLKSMNSIPLTSYLIKWATKNNGDNLEVVEEYGVRGGLDNEDGVAYVGTEFNNTSVYVEIVVVKCNENCHFGVSVPEFTEKSSWNNSSYCTYAYCSNSSVFSKSDESFKMEPWAAGDKIGVFINVSEKTVEFFKNGEKQKNPAFKLIQEKFKVYLHLNKDSEVVLNQDLKYPEEISHHFLLTKPSTSQFQELLKLDAPNEDFSSSPLGETVAFILKKLSDGLIHVESLFQSRNYKFDTKTPSYSFQLTSTNFKYMQELQELLYNIYLAKDFSSLPEACLHSSISSLQRLIMFHLLLAEQLEESSLQEDVKKKILDQTIQFIQHSSSPELSDEAMKLLSSCFEIFYKDPSVKISYINEALDRGDENHELQVFEELEGKIFSTIARPDKLFPVLQFINEDHISQIKKFYTNLINKAHKVSVAGIKGEQVKVSSLKLLSSAQAALFSQAAKQKFDDKHMEIISDYTLHYLRSALQTLKETQQVLKDSPSDEAIQTASSSIIGSILDELLNSMVLTPLKASTISDVLPLISEISVCFSGIPAGKSILSMGIGIMEEVYESPHNYPDSANLKHIVRIPAAIKYTLIFDPQCKTENGCDYLELWLDEAGSNKFARWEGESFPKEPVEVVNPFLHFTFRSDGSVNYWGWKIMIKASVECTYYKKQWPETSKDVIELFFSKCSGKMIRGELDDFVIDPDVAKALSNPLLAYGVYDSALAYVDALPVIDETIGKLSTQILKPAEYLVSSELQRFSFLPNYEVGLREYLEYYKGLGERTFCSNAFLNSFVQGSEELVEAWVALRKKAGIAGNHLSIGGSDLDPAERAIFAVYVSFFEISDTAKAILTGSVDAGATVKSLVKEACNIRYWAQKQKQKLFDGGKTEVTYVEVAEDVVKKCAILIGSDHKSSLNHIGISRIMKNLVSNIAKGQKTSLKLASKWKNVQDALKSAKKLTSLVSITNKSAKPENEDLKEFSRVAELVKSFLENPAPVSKIIETLNKHRSKAIIRSLGFLSISKLISFSSSEHETSIVKSFSDSLTENEEKLSYLHNIEGVDPLLMKSVQNGFFLVLRSIQEDILSSSYTTLNYELFSHFSSCLESLSWKYRGEDLHLILTQPLAALLKTLLNWAKGDVVQEQVQGKFLTDKCVTRIGLLTEEAVGEGKTKVLVDKPEGQPATYLVLDFGGSELPITQYLLTEEVREDLEEAVPEFTHAGSSKRIYVYRNEADPTKEYLTGIDEQLQGKFEKYAKLLGDPNPEEVKKIEAMKMSLMKNSWKLFKQMMYTLAGAWRGNNETTHLLVQEKFLKVLFSELRPSLDSEDSNLLEIDVQKLASGESWVGKGAVLRETPKNLMETWLEKFSNDSNIELAELFTTYRAYIDPLVTGSVDKSENEELEAKAQDYVDDNGKVSFWKFVTLIRETVSDSENLLDLKKYVQSRDFWLEVKDQERLVDFNDFDWIVKRLEELVEPSKDNLFAQYLELFKTHGPVVPAEHLKETVAVEVKSESGDLELYKCLGVISKDAKFESVRAELTRFYEEFKDLPQSVEDVKRSRKSTNDYISSLLMVIYGAFTSDYLSKALANPAYVQVLLSYLWSTKSISIFTLAARILGKVLPTQHSPTTTEHIWSSIQSTYPTLVEYLLNIIGKNSILTGDQRFAYESRNLLLSLTTESRWSEPIFSVISEGHAHAIESLNKGELLDCTQLGSILVLPCSFISSKTPFTLSVVSLRDCAFSWGIIKKSEAEGKFSVYSVIDDNSATVEGNKITSIENSVKANLLAIYKAKSSSLCENLFSIWKALNSSFSKPLNTQGEGFVTFYHVYKSLQSAVVTSIKDAIELFDIDSDLLSNILADLVEIKSSKESYGLNDFVSARGQILEKQKSLMVLDKEIKVEEVNEQVNLLDDDSKAAHAGLIDSGLSPQFALKCIKSGIKDLSLVSSYSDLVPSSLLSKLSLVEEAGLVVEDPDGQAEIYQNNFYHMVISDSHNSHKSLEFEAGSKIFDTLKYFTDEVTIRVGVECLPLEGKLKAGLKIGNLDLQFSLATVSIETVAIIRVIAKASGEVKITYEATGEVVETFDRSVFTGFSIGRIKFYLDEGSFASLVMMEIHNKAINSNFQGKIDKAIKSDMSERFVKIRSKAPDCFISRLRLLGLSSEQTEKCKDLNNSISEAVHYSLENLSPSESINLSEVKPISEIKIFDTEDQVPADFEKVKVFENFKESAFDIQGRKILAYKKASTENSLLALSIGELAGLESLGELNQSGDAKVVQIFSKLAKASPKEPAINSVIYIKASSINNVPIPRNYSVLTDKEGKAINIAPKSEKPYYLFIGINKTFEFLGLPVSKLETILPKFTTFGLVESNKSSSSDKKEKPVDYSPFGIISLYSLVINYEQNNLAALAESLVLTALRKSKRYFESFSKVAPLSKIFSYLDNSFVKKIDFLEGSDLEFNKKLLNECVASLISTLIPKGGGGRVLKSVTVESTHPYDNNMDVDDSITIPGATALRIEFDPQCYTENGCDPLRFYESSGRSGELKCYSGQGEAVWQAFEVPGDTVYTYFHSDGSVNYWGYKFEVIPVGASGVAEKTNSSVALEILSKASQSTSSSALLQSDSFLFPLFSYLIGSPAIEDKMQVLEILKNLTKGLTSKLSQSILKFLSDSAEALYKSTLNDKTSHNVLQSLIQVLYECKQSGIKTLTSTWFLELTDLLSDMNGVSERDKALDTYLFDIFKGTSASKLELCFESDHPYPVKTQVKEIKVEGASSIALDFSQDSKAEKSHTVFFSKHSEIPDNVLSEASAIDVKSKWEHKGPDIEFSNDGFRVTRTSSNGWGAALIGVKLVSGCTSFTYFIENDGGSDYLYLGFVEADDFSGVDMSNCFNSDLGKPIWTWKKNGDMHRHLSNLNVSSFGTGDTIKLTVNFEINSIICYKNNTEVYAFKEIGKSLIPLISFGGSNQFVQLKSIESVNESTIESRKVILPGESTFVWFPVNAGYFNTYRWDHSTDSKCSVSEDHFVLTKVDEEAACVVTNLKLDSGRHYFQVQITKAGEIGLGLLNVDSESWESENNSVFWSSHEQTSFAEGDVVGLLADFDGQALELFKNRRSLVRLTGKAFEGIYRFFAVLKTKDSVLEIKNEEPKWLEILTIDSERVSKEFGYKIKVTPEFKGRSVGAMDNFLKSSPQEFKEAWEAYRNSILPYFRSTAVEELVMFIDQFAASKGKDPVALTQEDLIIKKTELIYYPELEKVEEGNIFKLYQILQNFNKRVQSSLYLFDLNFKSELTDLQKFLIGSRNFIFFDIKNKLLKGVMEKTKNDSRTEINIDRPKAARHRNKKEVDSEGLFSIFGQIYRAMSAVINSNYRNSERIYKVNYRGEGSIDAGGPYNESMSNMCDELMSSFLRLLVPTSNNTNNMGEHRDAWIVNPSATSETELEMFKFLGKLMGAAIRTQNNLNLSLPPLFWKTLLREKLSVRDLKSADLCTVTILEILKNPEANELTPENFSMVYDEKFVTKNSAGKEVEVVPGGASVQVTFENCKEYAELVLQARLNESARIYDKLREGLSAVVPVDYLNLMSYKQLETLVCGAADVDVEILKENTDYEGCALTDQHITYFWEVLKAFAPRERTLFLKFVWGRTKLPSGKDWRHMKVTRLNPAGPVNNYMPVSHTCFFTLDLPAYTTKEAMEQKLLYAITHCTAIDLDGRAGDGWEEND